MGRADTPSDQLQVASDLFDDIVSKHLPVKTVEELLALSAMLTGAAPAHLGLPATRDFFREYLSDLQPTHAAHLAGYCCISAGLLLHGGLCGPVSIVVVLSHRMAQPPTAGR